MCAPIVVAPKKGTDNIRMCIDLSHLNQYHITLYLSRYIERNIHFESDGSESKTAKWDSTVVEPYQYQPLDSRSSGSNLAGGSSDEIVSI